MTAASGNSCGHSTASASVSLKQCRLRLQELRRHCDVADETDTELAASVGLVLLRQHLRHNRTAAAAADASPPPPQPPRTEYLRRLASSLHELLASAQQEQQQPPRATTPLPCAAPVPPPAAPHSARRDATQLLLDTELGLTPRLRHRQLPSDAAAPTAAAAAVTAAAPTVAGGDPRVDGSGGSPRIASTTTTTALPASSSSPPPSASSPEEPSVAAAAAAGLQPAPPAQHPEGAAAAVEPPPPPPRVRQQKAGATAGRKESMFTVGDDEVFFVPRRAPRGRWFARVELVEDAAGRAMPWGHPHNTPVASAAAAVVCNSFATQQARQERGALRQSEAATFARQLETDAALMLQCQWRVCRARRRVEERRRLVFEEFDEEMNELSVDAQDDS